MASLFERLFPEGGETDNIPVHVFYSAIVDYADGGNTTRQQIVAFWNLDAEAEAQLDLLCDHIDSLPNVQAKLAFGAVLHAVMLIAEVGVKYDTPASFAERLGLV